MIENKIPETYQLIKKDIKKTPLEFNTEISNKTDTQVFLKTENTQISGSFKYRGAISILRYLQQQGITNSTIVAASTGNHAAAVALASQKMGFEPIIFVPKNISTTKLKFIQQFNVKIIKKGAFSAETEQFAAEYAKNKALAFIHPYNNPQVIAGQGTIAIELLEQLPKTDAVFVPIGGGGLISGIAGHIKSVKPEIKVIGCQPINAPEMVHSIKLGKIVPPSKQSTISDGVAGGLDPSTVTFDICKKYVDEYVLLNENEISYALYLIFKTTKHIVEPAAALSVAAILKKATEYKKQNIIAILSGSRINSELFEQIVKTYNTNTFY